MLSIPMDCAICEAMKRVLLVAERDYQNSRGWLVDLYGTTDPERFSKARRLAEEARKEYEVARIDLEQHIATFHRPRVYG